MTSRSRSAYKRKTYSGPPRSKKRTKALLKRYYGEGVSLADVWALKNVQTLSFMKCMKCGSTKETDPALSFYKFPFPNSTAARSRAWAEYCWPDKTLTREELLNVYKEKQLLCSKHFPDTGTARRLRLQLGVPIDLQIENKKNYIVRTYGKKVNQETDSNLTAENQEALKHNDKEQKKPKHNFLTEGNHVPEHNFLQGENAAELFETIDEVFEDRTDVSLYDETVVMAEPGPSQENCDKLLHEGYKCDLCLSSISGYRYTCVQCEDVDVCAACEASGAHAGHYVLRVPRPRPEDEVEELLKELRRLLKKRPPADRPAGTTISPSDRMPAAEDPLEVAPASPDIRSTDQSESDDEATESESENESYPERPDNTDSPPVKTSRADLNPKNSQISIKQNEVVSPKRSKLGPYQKTMIRNPKISKEQAGKSVNSDNSNENSDTDEVSHEKNDVTVNNTLKEKQKASALEAALSSETVQKAKAQIEAEIELIEDNVGLEIGNENILRKGEDDKKRVELDENYGLSDIDKVRGRKEGLNAQHLQETLDEEPLDFIMHKENFNEDDPLATGLPSKASKNTENVQVSTGTDVRRRSKRRRFK